MASKELTHNYKHKIIQLSKGIQIKQNVLLKLSLYKLNYTYDCNIKPTKHTILNIIIHILSYICFSTSSTCTVLGR